MAGIGRFVFNRGEPDLASSTAQTYYGITYTTRFKVSRPIRLTHVGFFGPVRPNAALELVPALVGGNQVNLSNRGVIQEDGGIRQELEDDMEARNILAYVRVSIRESRYNDLTVPDRALRVYMAEQNKEVDVTNFIGGTVFMVECTQEGILLPPGVYFDVGFEIQGRHDHELKFHRLPNNNPTLSYTRILHTESNVEFSFLGSSKQLASIAFDQVPVDHDPRNAVSPGLRPSEDDAHVEGAEGVNDASQDVLPREVIVENRRPVSGIYWQDYYQPHPERERVRSLPPLPHSNTASTSSGLNHLYEDLESQRGPSQRRDGNVGAGRELATPGEIEGAGATSIQTCRIEYETGGDPFLTYRALRSHFLRQPRGSEENPFVTTNEGNRLCVEKKQAEVQRYDGGYVQDTNGQESQVGGGEEGERGEKRSKKDSGCKENPPSGSEIGAKVLNVQGQNDANLIGIEENRGNINVDRRQVEMLVAFANKVFRAGLCKIM